MTWRTTGNPERQWTRRAVLQSTAMLGLAATLPGSADPRWQTAAPLPLRVQEIYPCLHDGHIWVAGGLSADPHSRQITITDRVVTYDVQTNEWRSGPSLPEPRHHGYLVSMAGKLWLFGGFVAANGGRWCASRDVFRLENDTWVPVGKTPAAQTETVAAVSAGRVHLAGGRAPAGSANAHWNDQRDVDTHQVFDPETGETVTAPSLPMARNSAASFVIGDDWHVVGGRTVGGGNSARHDIYSFTEGRWREGVPLPQAQGGLAAASVKQQSYVFGGEYFSPDGGGVYPEVWHYDAAQERWQDAGTMPVPRHGLGAVTVGDAIYVVGGATSAGGNGTSDRISVFVP